MTPDKIYSGLLPASRGSKFELLLFGFCIVCSALIAADVALSLGSAEDHYRQSRTDPLVFRAVGDLLRQGKSPYSAENQLEMISASRLNGRLPPTEGTLTDPTNSLDLLAIRTRASLESESLKTTIPFSYPPNSLPFFRLRALGSPEINAALLMATTVFLSLGSLSLLIFRYVENPLSRQVIILVAALWNPTFLDLLLTQTGHLLAFLAFTLIICHERNPLLAGISLGLLAFKPHYAIPFALIALSRGNWQLLQSAALTFLLTVVSSGFLYGWEMWPAFWNNASSLNVTLFHMQSWLGVAAIIWPESILMIGRLAIPIYFVAMLLLCYALYRLRDRIDLLSAASLTILITVLFSPNTHPYDMQLFLVTILHFTRYFSMKMWYAAISFLVFLMPHVQIEVALIRFCFLIASLFMLAWIIRQEHASISYVDRTR